MCNINYVLSCWIILQDRLTCRINMNYKISSKSYYIMVMHYICVNHQHCNLDCTDDGDGSYFILLGLWSQTAVKLQQQGRGGASCNSWSTYIHKSCKSHFMLQIICSTGKLHKCNILIQIRSSEVFDSVISASCCNGWLFLHGIVFSMSETNATFNK